MARMAVRSLRSLRLTHYGLMSKRTPSTKPCLWSVCVRVFQILTMSAGEAEVFLVVCERAGV